MDQRCRESEGKAKIEGYMSVSDEEAHHRVDGRAAVPSGGGDARSFTVCRDQVGGYGFVRCVVR